MIPTAAPSRREVVAATAAPVASITETRPRKRRNARPKPLADVTGTIASASTATLDGQRGFEVDVAGVAQLRAESVSVAIGSLVFVPATASADEARDVVHRELARIASSRFASAGRTVPSERIAVVLR